MQMLTLETLQAFPQFQNLPVNQLEWMLGRLTIKELKKGEFLFEKDKPIDHLQLVLEGEIEVYFQNGNSKKTVNTIRKHDISGMLPYSRMKNATGYGVANQNTIVAQLCREGIKEMIKECHELTTVFVHEMNNRIRDFTQLQVQNEKLIALGKISAGLAHELNNPASAIVRSASLLQQHLATIPEDFKAVIKIKTTEEIVDAVNDFMFKKLCEKDKHLSIMEKSELEDDLDDWFSECNLIDRDDLIPLLVEYNFGVDDLEEVKSMLREEDFHPVLKWIVQNMTTQKTVEEIKEASERIENLIKSVKSYSYMDRNLDLQPVNLEEGIRNTLTVLNHKLQKVGHEVITDFEENLPSVRGLPGELNQVWTNIIDNAIDALPQKGGRLEIRTRSTENFVLANIIDNGHGIPEDIINNIFDPFFTTKEIGSGTGLGLDIVMKIIKQHNGSIKVISKPGETNFEVCIPKMK